MDYDDYGCLCNLSDKELRAMQALVLLEISESLKTICENQKRQAVQEPCWLGADGSEQN